MPADRGEALELLVELIRNRCVNDGTPGSGQEHRSVATLADFLGSQGRVFEPHPGRQSVLYRVPGRRRGAPRLMLLAHLDVVPVNPDGWSRDPFAGERAQGMVWGRGAVDMLNLAACMAEVFRPYLRGEAEPLAGDLLFLAVADEEAGGGWGAGYLVDHHWEEVACEYLLCEVAHPGFPSADGMLHPVAVGEKGPSWWRVLASGSPGHGSQPYGAANAVKRLAEAILRLSGSTPAQVTEVWRHFAESSGLAERGLADPGRLPEALEELAAESPALARWAHACTHLTVSPNLVRGGVKANVIPDRAEAEVDMRALPGQSAARYLEEALAGLEGVSAELVLDHAPTSSPADGPLWEAVAGALEEVGEQPRPVPVLMPVATDARFFRARGTVAYGVGLYDRRVDFPTFLSLFHGNDERVGEESLRLTSRFLAALLDRAPDRAT